LIPALTNSDSKSVSTLPVGITLTLIFGPPAANKDFRIPPPKELIFSLDVKFMAVDALAHRVILHIERIMEGRLATAVIRSIVTKTEVPKSFTRENAGGLL